DFQNKTRVASGVGTNAAPGFYLEIGVIHPCFVDPWRSHRPPGPGGGWRLLPHDRQVSAQVHTAAMRLRLAGAVLLSAVIEARSSAAVHVADSTLGGVPTRVFEPSGGSRPKRGVIYFHGGGWALGSGRMRSYDLLCRKMAEDLDAVVMSVDYRLAPEAVFPDQYHDALAASRAFLSAQVLQRYGVDPQRLCVSGDSAGGNLAAAVAQEVQNKHIRDLGSLCPPALIYPVLQALDFHTPSYQQNQAVPILYRPVMARFWLQYLGADSSLEPLLLANNHSSLDQPGISAEARSRLDWTGLLPAERRKHFRPLVRETGSAGVVGRVPGLTDVRAAPLLAERGVLGRTPKAYVMTCEFDVLRDDGLMYGRRLQDAGVPVTSDHYEDGFHGCMVFQKVGEPAAAEELRH
uniref:Neutral cholesterol ester hydrolase 1-like n=1 Tax=Stegastes partitus TaxID=144197 RepID=A0A3B5BAV7_9TELE